MLELVVGGWDLRSVRVGTFGKKFFLIFKIIYFPGFLNLGLIVHGYNITLNIRIRPSKTINWMKLSKVHQGRPQGLLLPPPVFVNSELIREDQAQNVVKFLSHPKIRGSLVMYRRSFLDKKRLSRKEIDEAFCRVHDPPPPTTTTPETIPNQDCQSILPINSQPQIQAQDPQSAVPPPSGLVSKMRARSHLSHAILAIGFLAASGAGTALFLRLKLWIRKVVLEEDGDDSLEKNTSKTNPAKEAVAAAKASASAASDVAKAS
ncbi:peroxisomal membrane protein PEX14-like isoform X2 [Papaver somniferum]|uniref:peroxisomal membrane protein PEX14-like isoform X2 n=1 Tax=Papaver somniferum TaxID=3469 RepID=UPI000E6F8140|nr:peroxisomal membrane protein PEX14-like isoform X2 [Papaver somniferum]